MTRLTCPSILPLTHLPPIQDASIAPVLPYFLNLADSFPFPQALCGSSPMGVLPCSLHGRNNLMLPWETGLPAPHVIKDLSHSSLTGFHHGTHTSPNTPPPPTKLLFLWFFFNWSIILYNIVLVSAAQQSESAICIYINMCVCVCVCVCVYIYIYKMKRERGYICIHLLSFDLPPTLILIPALRASQSTELSSLC